MQENYKENISEKKDRRKRAVCGILAICTAVLLTGILFSVRAESLEEKTAKVQEKIAGEVVRFHVIANSDSAKDQEIKLKVRDAVLSYMKTCISGQEESRQQENRSAEDTKRWAKSHLAEIEQTADEVLKEAGFSYRSHAEVTSCLFPQKRYADVVFPAGRYDALRIRLGHASGQNWWCVLYPNLCLFDRACVSVSKEGKEELREALDDEAYKLVTEPSEFKIKWFFFGGRTKEK